MKDLEIFNQFAKRSDSAIRAKGNNCLIYTRVSTKKQEDGYSLEIQLETTQEYAQKNKLNVIGYFGGKFESAQTDQERKEFNRMLQFARKSKERVSYVLVYTVDRFSRTGINGAYIKESLRQEGIELIAVTQPADTSNPGGRLQQNIQFIFSEYDNDLRREKCVAGMREKLLQGYWVGHAPMGYDMMHKNRVQVMTINEKGKQIKQAFVWKAQGVPNIEIVKRLSAKGLKIYKQKLHYIFNNPFYCGLMSHNMLEGKLVEGKHPPLISKELFLKVNDVSAQRKKSQHKKEFNDVPLKHYIKCGDCGTPFAGYEVKKKRLHYYKCNKTGCRCNKSAKEMHRKYENLLNRYTIEKKLIAPFKLRMVETFFQMNESNREDAKLIKGQLQELESKIEKLEERYAYGEITRDMYDKFASKLKGERAEISERVAEIDFQLSNLEDYIVSSLEIASNLNVLWGVKEFAVKSELQNLIFPEGIYYDRKINDYRTDNVNCIFDLISYLSSTWKGTEKEKADNFVRQSNLVAGIGFEPMTFGL
jgi:site-specific DNA recombinase